MHRPLCLDFVGKGNAARFQRARVVMVALCTADAALVQNVSYLFFLSSRLLRSWMTGRVSSLALRFLSVCSAVGKHTRWKHGRTQEGRKVGKVCSGGRTLAPLYTQTAKTPSCHWDIYKEKNCVFVPLCFLVVYNLKDLHCQIIVQNFFPLKTCQSLCFNWLKCHCQSPCLKLIEKWQQSLKCCLTPF